MIGSPRPSAAPAPRGQLPSVLIRGWVLERLRQETTGEELAVSRDELARIVREQVEAALRKAG